MKSHRVTLIHINTQAHTRTNPLWSISHSPADSPVWKLMDWKVTVNNFLHHVFTITSVLCVHTCSNVWHHATSYDVFLPVLTKWHISLMLQIYGREEKRNKKRSSSAQSRIKINRSFLFLCGDKKQGLQEKKTGSTLLILHALQKLKSKQVLSYLKLNCTLTV